MVDSGKPMHAVCHGAALPLPWDSAPTVWKWSKSITFVWLKPRWESDVVHNIHHLITYFCWLSFRFLLFLNTTTRYCGGIAKLFFFFNPRKVYSAHKLSSYSPLHSHTDTHIQTWKLPSVITVFFPLAENLREVWSLLATKWRPEEV